MIPRYIFLSVLFFSLHYLHAQKIIRGFEAPESVIKYEGKLYVSNIGGEKPNPMALDSNGFISELSAEGKMIRKKFSKAILNGPKGLAATGNTIFVADINRVVGFDIRSGDQVFELFIPEAAMLNDLCSVDNETLVVSETVHGKVYLIHIPSKTFDFIGSINGANGVTYDPKSRQLYACGMGIEMDGRGKLYLKDITSKDTVFTELPNSPTGIFDGLEMTDDTHLIVTDWMSFSSTNKTARFVVYDLAERTYKAYTALTSPADLYYDRASGMIYLPVMMKNSLWIANINTLKIE